jgi:hypothetical protein
MNSPSPRPDRAMSDQLRKALICAGPSTRTPARRGRAHRSAEDEPFVAVVSDGLELLAVGADARHVEHTVFFLPGMLAPKIHDSTFGRSVMSAISSQVFVQPSSASREAPRLRPPSLPHAGWSR